MQMLGNKPVIRHVYDNTAATGLFNDVFVVTDSDIIYKEIKENGGKVLMSKKEHESGSDRIAEAVAEENVDLSNFTFTFHFHALEKGMATHSSVLAWTVPGTGEPGGLLSMGSHRVGHD